MPAESVTDAPWTTTRLRVRYAETDQAGVVYHSNFLIWFEVGRVELCRSYGFNYRDMEIAADARLPVTEARVRFRNPARYDDLILVRTRIVEMRSRMITFAYEVVREDDGKMLADGETVHVGHELPGPGEDLPAGICKDAAPHGAV